VRRGHPRRRAAGDRGGVELKPAVLVVAAGAATMWLAKTIGITLDGWLQQTPLWVIDTPDGLDVEVYVDLVKGWSVTSHAPIRGRAHRRSVLGTRVKTKYVDYVPPDDRIVTPADEAEFFAALPPEMRQGAGGGVFTAGREVIPGDSTGLEAVEPWIEVRDGIVFASPGRATMTLEAAREVTLQALQQLGEARAKGLRSTGVCAPDMDWDEGIHMHFDDAYAFDDRAQRGES
jgi:hypothetical protein